MSGCGCELVETDRLERRTLLILLSINAVMFVVESVAGWFAESSGLLADSLDMLADASVYGVGLYAVGRSAKTKVTSAFLSGLLQIALAIGVIVDVVRRFEFGSDPVSGLMLSVGALAFTANLSCLWLISKHRECGVHMRASWIFSTNDVIANIGVIVSGALVMFLGSRIPDLVIGAAIAVIVVSGGLKILREATLASQSCSSGDVGDATVPTMKTN